MEKKKLISEGKLDKYGRVNDNTPNSWKTSFVDLSAVGTKGDPGTSSSATVPPANLVTAVPTAPPVTSAQSTEDQEEGTSLAKKVLFFLKKKKISQQLSLTFLYKCRGKSKKIPIFLQESQNHQRKKRRQRRSRLKRYLHKR